MSKYSKTQRFIVAIGCVIVFTLSKLIITSLEITWDVVLIATLMPSVVGLGVYWYMGVQIKPLQPFFKSKQFAINKNQDWAYEQAAL